MFERELSDAFYKTYSKIEDQYAASPFLKQEIITDKEKALKACENFSQELENRIRTFHNKNPLRDPERKLLESEYYTWNLLIKFAKAEITREKILKDPSNKIKNNFFVQFYDKYRQNRGSYAHTIPLKVETEYVPLSQYELVNDIIFNNELIYYLNHTIEWLATTGILDSNYSVMSISFNKVLSESNNKANIDPDHILNEHSKLDDRTRYEFKKLMKAVFEHLRRGEIVDAFDLLVRCNQKWQAASLNGGLPFHDFYFADEEKLSKIPQSTNILGEIKNHEKEATIFDFMKTKEWSQTLENRTEAYRKQLDDQEKISDIFFETFGNANWLLWLINCWNMALKEYVEPFERGVYAILGCNNDILNEIFKNMKSRHWSNLLWTELRTLTYFDAIKQYIRLSDFFKEKIPQSEVNEEDLVTILNSKAHKAFKKALDENGLVEDEVKKLLRERDVDDDLDTYNKLQLKLIESKIYSILEKSSKNWTATFKFIRDLSTSVSTNVPSSVQTERFIGHRLRFCAYFLKMIQRLEIKADFLYEAVDSTMETYIKYLIKENDTANIISLYNELNHEDRKIKGIAMYLTQIENHEIRLRYKEEMDARVPDLSKSIIKEIFQINQIRSSKGSLEIERRRFDSLRWLKSHDEDAIKESLRIIRQFLEEDNIEAAIRLKMELVDSIFNAAIGKNAPYSFSDNVFKVNEKEKQEHDRLFDAYLAHQTYVSLDMNQFGADMKNSVNSARSRAMQGPVDYARDAIQKIMLCLFGVMKEKRYVIYDLPSVFLSSEQRDRAEQLKTIQTMWTPRLVMWLVDIYETHFELAKTENLLTCLTNPDIDCLGFIEPADREEIIKRLSILLIRDSGFIASLLKGTKVSGMDTEFGMQ